MEALDLARWQFGITTVYHFLFVPLTIGLAGVVAAMEAAWIRTGNDTWLRATKFWGKLLLINFAIGVVTGIVLEFQFGMNWSSYSRFVGDVFGAPLAMEALLAFFMESTFLGLWIFGWNRLPRWLHNACMWAVAVGTLLSAYFILAANSWMQHPVGYEIEDGKGRLTDIWAVLTNSKQLVTFPHTIAGAFVTAGVFLIAISCWHMLRKQHTDVMRSSLKVGLWVTAVASIAVAVSGDLQAKVVTDQQPMKMAAAEALYETERPASFSLFTIGTLDGDEELLSIRVPRVLSYLATGDFDGEVQGIDDLQAQYEAEYGEGDYSPNIPVVYWSFRLMMGAGIAILAVSVVGLWLTRRGRTPHRRWVWWIGLAALPLPFIANSTGWLMAEMGRQPWTVFGVLRTSDSVSPTVGVGTVATSLITLTVLYGALAVVEVWLLLKYIKIGPPTSEEVRAELEPPAADEDRPEPSLVY
ncbi:cytochrome ubiquinol oxidase subunit I [Phytoactinopolyspora halotolerans]|uniref:Cytochrome ubiquinol oxidase subunit I n=1 Tax=Phytoactinopolyspora halotolerans TaxID=1981512 RepID=A0A6L9S7R8_9ACTN|nr:cytochrome ubiquinol oxidase subunit I [Phytoactinopolyspora halotolerans]NEE00612.1 cytochrome ubiquinol oxidase subunit I [Phytoactinopolyspora halotolerans]